MTVRRNFIFRSAAFNTSEPKEYFINECCFGDDFARWLIERLRTVGIQAESEPGQEDFGWYVGFRAGQTDYDLVIAYRLAVEGLLGDWMCTVERRASLIGAVFGGRNRGIEADAVEALHRVLSSASEISELRWFADDDYERQVNGQSTPTEG